MYKRTKLKNCILPLLLVIVLLFPSAAYAAEGIPEFDGKAAIELNRNIPVFPAESRIEEDVIAYSPLDALGRPGTVTACLSRATLPTQLRTEDEADLPVGWQVTRYDGVNGKFYLYTLCHLLSPALGGDPTANENVFTGTNYLCRESMKLFEDVVLDYITRTPNHVLYRVTPVYDGDDLLPLGVQIQARSAEDAGRTVSFNVFLYNVQPGIRINYLAGQSIRDALVVVDDSAKTLLDSHHFSAPAPVEASKYESFNALYEQYRKTTSAAAATQTQSSSSPSIPQRAWAVKNDPNDRKFHKTETCSNTNNPTAYKLESVVKALEPCEACWTAEEYAYLMAVHNGTATLPASAQTQSASSAAGTQSQSTPALPQLTPAPSPSSSAQSQSSGLTVGGLVSNILSADSGGDELPGDSMVWLSTDKQYHRIENCENMNPLYAYQRTLDWCELNGYTPCDKCW